MRRDVARSRQLEARERLVPIYPGLHLAKGTPRFRRAEAAQKKIAPALRVPRAPVHGGERAAPAWRRGRIPFNDRELQTPPLAFERHAQTSRPYRSYVRA